MATDASPTHEKFAAAPRLTASAYALMFAAGGLWVMCVGWLAVWRHQQFLSHRFDLGHMVQAVWSTSQGRPLEFTDPITGEQITRLAVHVDPILVLFVPLWRVMPAPEVLVVAQAFALALGLYPVARLSLKYTRSLLATTLLGAWYLTTPWVIWNAVNDFHGVTLSVPLILYAIWFLDEHEPVPFAIAAVLALLCGELVGLTIAALGVWYAVHHRRRRAGVTIAALGAGWTAVCLLLVIPALNHGSPNRYYGRFETVGGSPRGVATTLVTEPQVLLEALMSTADLRYLLLVAAPTAFLAVGSIGLAAVALPQLLINCLSDFWSTTQPMFQYTMPAIAPLIAATVVGAGRFSERYRVWAAALPFVAAILVTAAHPPLPGVQDFVFGKQETFERVGAMKQALTHVPPDAAVVTTNRLGAHVSERRHVYLFPMRSSAEWAIVDTRDAWLEVAGEQIDHARFDRAIAALEQSRQWRLAFDEEGVRVYHRVHDESPAEVLPDAPEPAGAMGEHWKAERRTSDSGRLARLRD